MKGLLTSGAVGMVCWLAGTAVALAHRTGEEPAASGAFRTAVSERYSLRHPTVIMLAQQAADDLQAGRPERAAVGLERALHIEPGSPLLWHYLAQARLHQGRYEQALAFTRKSDALAAGDGALRARNAWLRVAIEHAAGHGMPRPAVTYESARAYVSDRESCARPAPERPGYP